MGRAAASLGLFPLATLSHVAAGCCAITIRRQRNGVPTSEKRKTMRIKNVRRGLNTLLQTQDLDGLLDLYKGLEKRGRALLLCLLCAEAGWQILVIAWLRLERGYLTAQRADAARDAGEKRFLVMRITSAGIHSS
jgi:hypothetical protein